ncbi:MULTISPECIES: FAD-binding oxidoreductase [unclassified Mesorhizobium]|uniref:FAD-binding oxidoreductase n=1 Tax=unclassified Mesorhizobium TaxID=325217 RepID=UPI000FCAD2BD|nr:MULTISPECIES: FAD-binding oxidoreductase [unclassified Mesorhizobium]RUT87978.1 FAD-binding oxidoreductase [Mesorhizobium sp. M7A.T.Ca.US.000.02.1.1]RUT92487.1 FAD-binding oxidoreductase [Mesorhizobium sp. M7A.T.Ca.US.000.02.2.1]RUT99995.1 FAD-binding oxidoreductase [Mesorhizobium sp. M7A.T.Ca.TU.009.02.1.1]RUU67026.1 FAD-binding oxidoreductase [Mesorhizobium sp. M7A.T.Ca.TU.009.01.1.1]
MNTMSLTTLERGKTTIDAAALEAFSAQLRGKMLSEGDAAYDEARTVWNATVDRLPGLIVCCVGASDVISAVNFARENRLLVSVRGGGHNIAGSAVCVGGLMIDLSLMKSVRVDVAARRAWVGPGATLADVDKETQAFGLVVPTGINSTTGISGLTLGGGFGWITRKFGLTIDNLASVDVVTADGKLLRASKTENPDLFWALRGGGGNFGVVTAFEFHLHEFGPQVLAGLVVHPFADAEKVLREYRKALETAPDELTCWVVMRQAPPLPFLPAEWHGKEVLVLAMCYCGDIETGEKATQKLRAIGTPIADVVGPSPFTGWQQAFDPLLTPGARNYWKSHDFTEFSEEAAAVVRWAIAKLPGPECEIFIGHVGGAAGRVKADATAFPQRSSHFVMNVHARWREPTMDKACTDWARSIYEAAKPYAAGTAYVNFMPEDEVDRVEAAYGGNHRRLLEIKQRYDPLNLFRMNQNLRPKESLRAA